MNTLALIAALCLTDGQSNPGALTATGISNSAFQNPYPGILGADAGVFSGVVADAGYIGGVAYAQHIGQIAGAPGPTCGNYPGASSANYNPFDGGTSCLTGSTDMSGTLQTLAGPTGGSWFSGATPALYMIPGTAFSSTTKCIVEQSGPQSDTLANNPVYAQIDAGAGGALQISMSTTSTITGSVTYTFDWICLGP